MGAMTNEDIATELLDELARSHGYYRCAFLRMQSGLMLDVAFLELQHVKYAVLYILENDGKKRRFQAVTAASAVRLLWSAIAAGEKVMVGDKLLDADGSGTGKFMVDCVLKGLT